VLASPFSLLPGLRVHLATIPWSLFRTREMSGKNLCRSSGSSRHLLSGKRGTRNTSKGKDYSHRVKGEEHDVEAFGTQSGSERTSGGDDEEEKRRSERCRKIGDRVPRRESRALPKGETTLSSLLAQNQTRTERGPWRVRIEKTKGKLPGKLEVIREIRYQGNVKRTKEKEKVLNVAGRSVFKAPRIRDERGLRVSTITSMHAHGGYSIFEKTPLLLALSCLGARKKTIARLPLLKGVSRRTSYLSEDRRDGLYSFRNGEARGREF